MSASTEFLRHLPIAIPLETRLILEALITSVDISIACYENIIEKLTEFSSKVEIPVELSERSLLSAYVWSIVDNAHMVRNFAKRLDPEIVSIIEKDLENISEASSARNKMDHRHSNIRNNAKISKPVQPVHGLLTYLQPSSLPNVRSFHTIALGPVQQQNAIVGPSAYFDWQPHETRPTRVSLYAHGVEIQLDNLTSALLKIIEMVGSFTQSRFAKSAKAYAEAKNVPLVNITLSAPTVSDWYLRLQE